MLEVLYLSLIVASISFLVTESTVFAPLRQWLEGKNSFLHKLVSCGYCFGHWIALGLAIIYQPRLLNFWAPLDIFLTALIIAWISGFQWCLMCYAQQKIDK